MIPGSIPPPSHRLSAASIDAGVSALARGEHLEALRWAVALVEQEASAPLPWLVLGECVAALDPSRRELAAGALALATVEAAQEGELLLAFAACRARQRLGQDASAELEALARHFGAGSGALVNIAPAPPPLGVEQRPVQPLSAQLDVRMLIQRSAQATEAARAARGGFTLPRAVRPKRILSSMSPDDLLALVGALELSYVDAGEQVVVEGAVESSAYFIARGEVQVLRRGAEGSEPRAVARLGRGGVFGEMALLTHEPRSASVVTERPCVLLVVSEEALERLSASEHPVRDAFLAHGYERLAHNVLLASPVLSGIEPEERRRLEEHLEARSHARGETLIAEGQEPEGLFLVASGQLEVHKEEDGEPVVVAVLGVGDVVGDIALILRRRATATVVATRASITLFLPGERFLQVVRHHPQLLADLYELAVTREEQTSAIADRESLEVDELMLL